MNNKKDIKQQVRSDLTMIEELKKLKQDLETYKKIGIELGNEIITLKRQNAGLKGLNKQLQKRVEHYKQLDLEGDELNEKKIAKIETLTNELEEVNKKLQKSERDYSEVSAKAIGCRDVIQKLNLKISDLEKENTALRATIESYKTMPWYKKIFRHK